MNDGYRNEVQRYHAALAQGWASHADPALCACHGTGWILSEADVFIRCPMHRAERHPNEEGFDPVVAGDADAHVFAWLAARDRVAERARLAAEDDLPF